MGGGVISALYGGKHNDGSDKWRCLLWHGSQETFKGLIFEVNK